MAIPSKIRIVADAYYQLSEYTENDLVQLIDGEVITPMPPIPKHQAIVGEILFLLMTLAKKIGGKAFTSPIEVYLDVHNVYEPDVLYLSPESNCAIEEKRLVGAPELVVEVLSPGTAKYDRREKYQAYQKHVVQEYWIVDPAHDVLEVFALQDDVFVRQGVYGKEDTFESVVLGDKVSLKDIFAE